MCLIIYFQVGVWGRPESLNHLWGKHWHVHVSDLFTWRKYMSNFSWIKQSHLGKFNNKKLRALILVNDGSLKNKADFASALDNVNNVKITDLLAYVVILLFSSICSHVKNCLWWRHAFLESCKIMKTSTGEILLQKL